MLLFIIFGVLFIGSIVFFKLCYDFTTDNENASISSVYALVLSGIAFCIMLTVIIFTQVDTEQKLNNNVSKRQAYELALEHPDEVDLTNDFFKDVVDFNNDIIEANKSVGNPWTNWFYNPGAYEGIEPIDLGEYIRGE